MIGTIYLSTFARNVEFQFLKFRLEHRFLFVICQGVFDRVGDSSYLDIRNWLLHISPGQLAPILCLHQELASSFISRPVSSHTLSTSGTGQVIYLQTSQLPYSVYIRNWLGHISPDHLATILCSHTLLKSGTGQLIYLQTSQLPYSAYIRNWLAHISPDQLAPILFLHQELASSYISILVSSHTLSTSGAGQLIYLQTIQLSYSAPILCLHQELASSYISRPVSSHTLPTSGTGQLIYLHTSQLPYSAYIRNWLAHISPYQLAPILCLHQELASSYISRLVSSHILPTSGTGQLIYFCTSQLPYSAYIRKWLAHISPDQLAPILCLHQELAWSYISRPVSSHTLSTSGTGQLIYLQTSQLPYSAYIKN